MSITHEEWGRTADGQTVFRYTLKNKTAEVKIINYGGIITNVLIPDKNGKLSDVVLGFDSFEGYKEKHPYFGALIGRYGNRIANGRFRLDDVGYTLAVNQGTNALHGGLKGFDKRVWGSNIEGDKLVLSYVSTDGEEGYPGELSVHVSYQLTSDNQLMLNYMATTTKATVVNLTNHSYFNLAGHETGSVQDHVVRIDAPHYLPIDDNKIPTGVIQSVTGTCMDLTSDVLLGTRLPEVAGGFGFDHNYCLGDSGSMKQVARVHHPGSGRCMTMFSTEPGVQFYTGSNLNGIVGKSGAVYNKYASICLEAQHYPNSPNQDNFPSAVLSPDQVYMQTTVYKFSVED